ncbi:MAG: glycogen debranching enzyme N-terminal domain-containing protein, partial [Chthoniobacterales bacterium]
MQSDYIRKIDIARAQQATPRQLLQREWLITNGLGGYASGTISGMVSRRYHGLLVAALPAPLGRVVMFNHLAESLRLPDGRTILIGGEEPCRPGDEACESHYVSEFSIENGLPTWRFEAEGVVLEKRVLLVHRQNTAHIFYRLLSGHDSIHMELRPGLHFRGHEENLGAPLTEDYGLTIHGHRYEVSSPTYPSLRFHVHDGDATFTHRGGRFNDVGYAIESERGYHSAGTLWSPGYFGVELRQHRLVTLVASTENWETMLALDPEAALASDFERRRRLVNAAHPCAREGAAAELVIAADQFIITPAGRVEDAARA